MIKTADLSDHADRGMVTDALTGVGDDERAARLRAGLGPVRGRLPAPSRASYHDSYLVAVAERGWSRGDVAAVREACGRIKGKRTKPTTDAALLLEPAPVIPADLWRIGGGVQHGAPAALLVMEEYGVDRIGMVYLPRVHPQAGRVGWIINGEELEWPCVERFETRDICYLAPEGRDANHDKYTRSFEQLTALRRVRQEREGDVHRAYFERDVIRRYCEKENR